MTLHPPFPEHEGKSNKGPQIGRDPRGGGFRGLSWGNGLANNRAQFMSGEQWKLNGDEWSLRDAFTFLIWSLMRDCLIVQGDVRVVIVFRDQAVK
jgi:hypothetical protein